MTVRFFSEDIVYKINYKRRKTSLVKYVILNEGFVCGDLNIVVCSDKYLLALNQKYLDRDYHTDIITFSFSEGKKINGDLYISIDRIHENAKEFNIDSDNELTRVIIHGVLHLCGYNDACYEEQKVMRQMEDYYLERLV